MSKTPKPVHAAKPAAHPKPPASHPKLVTKKPSKGHVVHGSTSTTPKTKRPASPKPANPAPSRPLDISIVMEKYFGAGLQKARKLAGDPQKERNLYKYFTHQEVEMATGWYQTTAAKQSKSSAKSPHARDFSQQSIWNPLTSGSVHGLVDQGARGEDRRRTSGENCHQGPNMEVKATPDEAHSGEAAISSVKRVLSPRYSLSVTSRVSEADDLGPGGNSGKPMRQVLQ
ncbi:hypothetical protein EXIGLDRAFT_701810 [Exidia glandulosa HHB12029]|uniref:Uncharacterized protein n=1 Tax=Exidia glandulosa HHB12029 TaxID=1314781 RepID=A0A165CV61_EXIGL|nr:hypothetical protein EXIGLDRAFT_701810 [Exidia glandulosa HHB12029]